jgi:hypothetical protein
VLAFLSLQSALPHFQDRSSIIILGFSRSGSFLVGYTDGQLFLWHVDLSRRLAVTCTPLATLLPQAGHTSFHYPSLPCFACPLPLVHPPGEGDGDTPSSQQLNLTVLQSASENMLCVLGSPSVHSSTASAHGDILDQGKITVICCPVPAQEDLESGRCPVLRCARLEFYLNADAPGGDQHLCDLPFLRQHLLILNSGDLLRCLELSSAAGASALHQADFPSASSYFPPRVQVMPPSDAWFNSSPPLDVLEVITDGTDAYLTRKCTTAAVHASVLTQSSFDCEGFVRTLLAAQLRKGGSLVDFHMRVVDPLFRPPWYEANKSECGSTTWGQFALLSIVAAITVRTDSKAVQGRSRESSTKRSRPINETFNVHVGILAAFCWRDGSVAVIKTLKLQAPGGTKGSRRLTTPELLAQLAGRVAASARADQKLVCPRRAAMRGGALNNSAVLKGTPVDRLVNPALPVAIGRG